jgi:curved DNA-binding protein
MTSPGQGCHDRATADQHSNQGENFIDYYELLQISPNAEVETIHRVYRMLAARFHPDNAQTGDLNRFVTLNSAYETLSDPQLRREYDLVRQDNISRPIGCFEQKEFDPGLETEANRRMGILCLLYQHRRTMPDIPGLSILAFENKMAIPREVLMFTVWYLKEKGYVRQDDKSDFVITAEGCDYVESNLNTHQALYKLLKAGESGQER